MLISDYPCCFSAPREFEGVHQPATSPTSQQPSTSVQAQIQQAQQLCLSKYVPPYTASSCFGAPASSFGHLSLNIDIHQPAATRFVGFGGTDSAGTSFLDIGKCHLPKKWLIHLLCRDKPAAAPNAANASDSVAPFGSGSCGCLPLLAPTLSHQ